MFVFIFRINFKQLLSIAGNAGGIQGNYQNKTKPATQRSSNCQVGPKKTILGYALSSSCHEHTKEVFALRPMTIAFQALEASPQKRPLEAHPQEPV